MTKVLDHFISNILSVSDGDEYEIFVDHTEQIYSDAKEHSELWFSRIFLNLSEYPESYILELIQVLVENIDASSFQSTLEKVYRESGAIAKKVIIECLELREDNVSLNFLSSLRTESESLEISRISSMVGIESEIKSGDLQTFLIESYSRPYISDPLKQKIYECLSTVYDYTHQKDESHELYCLKQREQHIDLVLKSVQKEYQRKRYKTVVKLLSQFEESELSEIGVKYLKISKRKLAQKKT